MAIDRKEAVRQYKETPEKAPDPSEDLAVLEAMWRDKLAASGELYD